MVIPQTMQTCPVPFPAHVWDGAGKSHPLARRSRTVWRRSDCGISTPGGLLLGRSQAIHRGLGAQERQPYKAGVRATEVCAPGGYGGKTDRICPIGDRERGQAESPERAGVAVRHGSVFPHWSQTNLCTRLRAPGERNIVSSARSIWPLVYRVVPKLSTASLRRHDAHINLPR